MRQSFKIDNLVVDSQVNAKFVNYNLLSDPHTVSVLFERRLSLIYHFQSVKFWFVKGE